MLSVRYFLLPHTNGEFLEFSAYSDPIGRQQRPKYRCTIEIPVGKSLERCVGCYFGVCFCILIWVSSSHILGRELLPREKTEKLFSRSGTRRSPTPRRWRSPWRRQRRCCCVG